MKKKTQKCRFRDNRGGFLNVKQRDKYLNMFLPCSTFFAATVVLLSWNTLWTYQKQRPL